MQPRAQSLAEAVTGTALGFGLALAVQVVVFPLFGLTASLGEHAAIVAIFTALSVARTYCVRRAFEWWHGRR